MNKKHCLVLILALVLALPAAVWINTQECVVAGGERFVKRGETLFQSTRSTVELEGNEAMLWLQGDVMRAEVIWQENGVTIVFDDGETVSGTWNGRQLTNASGGKAIIADALCRMQKGVTEPAGGLWVIACGVALYAFGAWLWLIPSVARLSRVAQRGISAAVMLLALFWLLFPLFC